MIDLRDETAGRETVGDPTGHRDDGLAGLADTRRTAPPQRSSGRLPHFPAIEGLRGLAVVGVVLFHANFTWMKGGYLGVSTFFTLSGFLITSLLLAERAATSSIDLRRFWVRRFRRLMPASLAALALIALFGVLAADAAQRRNLGGDVIGALAYVANWRFLLSHQSYGDLFTAPSPVLHFWSLAIEEQFYLVFPLLSWFALKKLRVGRAIFALILGVLAAASLALTLFGGLSNDAIYYSTLTRAIELLAGALLATLVYHRGVTTVMVRPGAARSAIAIAGPLALLASLVLWVTVAQDSPWLYRGGLAGYSLLSAVVIVAAISPRGPVHRLLALRPLRFLGAISYGIYVFHWPVFQWLDTTRTGLSGLALFAVQVAVTLAIALLSHRLLESPIRRGERLGRIRPVAIAPFVVAAIAATVVGVTVRAPAPAIDFDSAEAQMQTVAANSGPPPSGPINTAAAEAPFPRMSIFGDSTALMTGIGLSDWARESGKSDFVAGDAKLGCGIGRGGERRSYNDARVATSGPIADVCNHWERNWKQKVLENEPNVAIVQVGPWEVADRKLEGDTVWRALGDPVYDAYLAREMDLAVDTLSTDGAMVVWLTSPLIGANEGVPPLTARGEAADPARMIRLNELINALPAKHPGKVQVVDLATWLASTGEDARLRPDGVHFAMDKPVDGQPYTGTTIEVAKRWLGEAVLKAYKDGWKQRNELGPQTATSGTPPTTATSGDVTDKTANGVTRTVAVLGDETAGPLADALAAWGTRTGRAKVIKALAPDCGVLKVTGREDGGVAEPPPATCAGAALTQLQTISAAKPDVILIVPSRWDFAKVQLPGQTVYRTWGDIGFTYAAREQMADVAKALNRTGAAIVWLDSPTVVTGTGAPTAEQTNAFRRVLGGVGGYIGTDYNLQASAFDKYLRGQADNGAKTFGENGTLDDGAATKVGEWLGDEVLTRYDDWWTSGQKIGG